MQGCQRKQRGVRLGLCQREGVFPRADHLALPHPQGCRPRPMAEPSTTPMAGALTAKGPGLFRVQAAPRVTCSKKTEVKKGGGGKNMSLKTEVICSGERKAWDTIKPPLHVALSPVALSRQHQKTSLGPETVSETSPDM